MAAPIGKILRDARLARDLSLEDVQHQTRIARPLLAAMEDNDLGAFPNQTYARKFFAAYARHLGVDVTEFLSHFRPSGLGGVMRYHPYLQPSADRAGPPRGGTSKRPAAAAPSGALFLMLTTIGLVAVAAVWMGQNDRRASAPAGTLTITGAPGATVISAPSRRESQPSRPPIVTAIQPPDLPVLRATPVEEGESDDGAPSAPRDGPALPLVENPRLPAPR